MRLDVMIKELTFLLAAMLALGIDMGEALQHLMLFDCTRIICDRVPVRRRRFRLADVPLALCRRRFRFYAHEIIQLEEALELPEWIYSAQDVPVPRQEAI
ncbi:hypothetical protein PR003_g30817 [Phytophthora rubi]|uniref:Secreted protein n=1 Tax=Phytophthora rubi TaxID=129364 RepID=A0A6A3GV22_9STRA|nr:hypothetical protein PR001_g30313 [Phytophthora rubi]KAE8960861.1 hypothetical protein PR002_g30083 [Phytophthora rubi]KAE9270440.1 hypothetical protein PR003_g30817 [Phytophthora rubi]